MSEASDAIRRKRLRYRAWHRGSREMDLLLGRFADEHLATMSEGELSAFERIMETPDPDLYAFLSGRAAPPANLDRALLGRIGKGRESGEAR
jgi:antitoxin CptB